jgi:hypothetical protein
MDSEASSLDSSWLGWSAESAKEISEKQWESYKKAQAQLQKSKKDEKKAKWDNDALFKILFRFIQNPYYESFIPTITELLTLSVPSRFIICFTALIYPESALYILSISWKKSDIDILLNLHRYESLTEMDESTLHPTIRTWMSTWSQMTQQFLLDPEWSVIMYQKMLSFLQGKEKNILKWAIQQAISFFFLSRNIHIQDKVAESYSEFIIKEYVRNIKEFLNGADVELLINSDLPLDASSLFGLSR